MSFFSMKILRVGVFIFFFSEWLSIEELPPVIEPRNASEILKKLLKNYDKRLRPGHAGIILIFLFYFVH